MLRIRPIEIFLIQCAIYLGLWLYDEYTGLLFSVIFTGIFLVILIISLIVEKNRAFKSSKILFLFDVGFSPGSTISFCILSCNYGVGTCCLSFNFENTFFMKNDPVYMLRSFYSIFYFLSSLFKIAGRNPLPMLKKKLFFRMY